jgi:hypothetical protein
MNILNATTQQHPHKFAAGYKSRDDFPPGVISWYQMSNDIIKIETPKTTKARYMLKNGQAWLSPQGVLACLSDCSKRPNTQRK